MFINNLCYEASAGSGKTFMLVVRYLSLLFKGADASKILALTFTNKAALEMQERVVLTLEELAERGELDEIVKVTTLSREYILENRARVLSEFLNANSKIMTIDKFFAQILRKFSLYASLMPDFTTFSSQHELKLLSRFLKEVSVAGKRESLINLSLSSNKRVSDIFKLLDDFYAKKEELSHLKFEKQELWQFEQEALGELESLKTIVARCSGASATVQKAVEAESFDELCAKSWLSRESLEYRTFAKCFTPEMDVHLKKIQNAVRSHHKAKEQNFFYALSGLVDIYEKSKKALYMEDSELSFNDVTALVYEILHTIDDSEFLYFRLDAQIEHILLDEFQDTSILQYEILRPLIEEITSGSGIFDEGSFFFVGDVKQSIYRFRGGVSALFGAVVEQQRTEVQQLLTNYRSQRELIEFVNSTFESKIKNYSAQKVREEANDGYVAIVQNDELLEETLTQVKMLIQRGMAVDEIAVLCATNGDGELVKQRLQEEHIEVVTETTTKLINQRSVKALLEYLKYLYFHEEIYRHNFFALINVVVQKIERVDVNVVPLMQIIKNAIEKYGLFSDDFHLIRFLNVVRGYSDIEALLFEYERLDAAAAASDLSGVRVLTIHKSKGLEYESVIVMDRVKKAPALRDAIIYKYDQISLLDVYLRIKGRDGLDEEYAEALSHEKSLAQEDLLNALYVAFTRARENLFIISKSKDSMFAPLDLEFKAQGELKESLLKVEIQPQVQLEKLEFHEFYYGTQSDILALEESKEEDLSAINFGLSMHYMLEMLSSFTLNVVDDAYEVMLNKYGASLEDAELLEIRSRVEALVSHSEFQTLVQGEIYKEKAIRYRKNLRYIDLLVKHEDGHYSIVDYKSALSYTDHHHKQVAYYVKAVQAITGERVEGYICYLLSNEVKLIKINKS